MTRCMCQNIRCDVFCVYRVYGVGGPKLLPGQSTAGQTLICSRLPQVEDGEINEDTAEVLLGGSTF